MANAQLRTVVGSPIVASAISFTVGALALLIVSLFSITRSAFDYWRSHYRSKILNFKVAYKAIDDEFFLI